jgi:hypothetical protein
MPQPVVPPTTIVPACVVVITTEGVSSLVGVEIAVVSEGVATAVSITKVVNVTEPMFPASSVTRILQLAYDASARPVPPPSASKVRVVAVEQALRMHRMLIVKFVSQMMLETLVQSH